MTRITRDMLSRAFPDQPRMVRAFEDIDKALDEAGLEVAGLEAAIAAAVATAGDIPALLAAKQTSSALLTALANIQPSAGVIEMAGANQFAVRKVGGADSSSLATVGQLTGGVGTGYQPLDMQLTDIAALVYAGNAGKVIKVNAGATAFELAVDATGGGGSGYTILTKTAAYTETATSGEVIALLDLAAGFTVTLPTAVGNTAKLVFKKMQAAGSMVIDGAGAETIDGGLTATLTAQYESITIVSNGSFWSIV